MGTVVDRVAITRSDDGAAVAPLFQVWIDLNHGDFPPNWWWNTPPQSLQAALNESNAARRKGWHTVVMPEGSNPRPDGRWDNPV